MVVKQREQRLSKRGTIQCEVCGSTTEKLAEKKRNKLGPAQDGAPLKFLNHAKDAIFKRLSISQCRKIPQGTHKTRKPLFPQLETPF